MTGLILDSQLNKIIEYLPFCLTQERPGGGRKQQSREGKRDQVCMKEERLQVFEADRWEVCMKVGDGRYVKNGR